MKVSPEARGLRKSIIANVRTQVRTLRKPVRGLCLHQVDGDLRHERLVAVANHCGNAFKFGNFFGRALCIAAGDDDPCRGIQTVHASNIGAGLAVGLGGHAAGVYDHHVSFRMVLHAMLPGGAQPFAHRLAIGASGAATEVLDVKAGHDFSLACSKQQTADSQKTKKLKADS